MRPYLADDPAPGGDQQLVLQDVFEEFEEVLGRHRLLGLRFVALQKLFGGDKLFEE